MTENVMIIESKDFDVDESIIKRSLSIYLINIAYKENLITKEEYLKIKSIVQNGKK